MCCGAALSWGVETIRQQVLSSTEAEYCTAAAACKEILAQQVAFQEMQLEFPQQHLVLIDNQSAIALACGPGNHYQRTKHIDTKYHFQRQLLLEGVVRYQHQSTQEQIADMMTKDLGKTLHRKFREVAMGKKPLQIVSLKLPHSNKEYIRRHNEEIQRRLDELDLKKKFDNQVV